jgi:hypothetical protein
MATSPPAVDDGKRLAQQHSAQVTSSNRASIKNSRIHYLSRPREKPFSARRLFSCPLAAKYKPINRISLLPRSGKVHGPSHAIGGPDDPPDPKPRDDRSTKSDRDAAWPTKGGQLSAAGNRMAAAVHARS